MLDETILFPLLRKFDYVTIKYLFTQYSDTKKININVNYYNRSGMSPLNLALALYNKEKELFPKRFGDNQRKGKGKQVVNVGLDAKDEHDRKEKPETMNRNVKKSKHLYEYLLTYGNVNDSIKKNIAVSPLGFALSEIRDVEVCNCAI